jgi:hypothetical protein
MDGESGMEKKKCKYTAAEIVLRPSTTTEKSVVFLLILIVFSFFIMKTDASCSLLKKVI